MGGAILKSIWPHPERYVRPMWN